MKRNIVVLILLLSFIPAVRAQHKVFPPSLSDSAFASILTCGPGQDFYESFGHTALRICDSNRNFDVVFNYGTFNFGQPNFYLMFALGQLDYYLAVQSYNSFLDDYIFEGRAVMQQRLLLSKHELDTLYQMLLVNMRPENKNYKYDFFRDNCATRVVDMVAASLEERQLMNDTLVVPKATYRDMIHTYTDTALLWWRLGIDLILGARCDQSMTGRQNMYMPIELMCQLDTSLLSTGKRLTEKPSQLLEEEKEPPSKSFSPTLAFWLIFLAVLAITMIALHRHKNLPWLDALFFLAPVLISILIMFLWFGSDHWCTKWNLNILWASPIFLWPLLRLRKSTPASNIVPLIFMLIFLVIWPLLPQSFNPAVLPIVLTLIVRLLHRMSYSR
ncbi:MAG: DUF4105 domain-containing protein [Bacteroidales bacterium]|nr:DUF4105 domain-containing protein [Bacteroidales bacterium]